MSNNLEVKKQVVADITKKFKKAQSVVVVQYKGLTVEQATGLRSKFREENVEYCVLKNTLVKRAANELGITGLDDTLEGPSAFAFGYNDPVSPARILSEFISKDKTNALEIKSGLINNQVISVDQIKELAKLPSKEVLISRLLGSLNATIGSFVRVLDAIRKKQSGEDTAE